MKYLLANFDDNTQKWKSSLIHRYLLQCCKPTPIVERWLPLLTGVARTGQTPFGRLGSIFAQGERSGGVVSVGSRIPAVRAHDLEYELGRKRLAHHFDADRRRERTCGHGYGGNIGERRVGLQRLDETKAAHDRHHEIDEDEVRSFAINSLESLRAVLGRRDLVAEFAQEEIGRAH